MISLSYKGMMNTVDRAVEHYDETLTSWRDDLVMHIKVYVDMWFALTNVSDYHLNS